MAANNTTDLKNGVVGEVGCKYPATVASLTNITLEGYQTINGVSVTDEMIVLVRGQADKTENGIYVPSTGEWQRAVWFDDELDATSGTLVFTSLGTLYADTLWRTVCTDDPIVFGTSEIEFEIIVSGDNTGDITLTGQDYLTLVNQALTANKISLSNMADLAANSFIGNNTGSVTAPIALTAAQATAVLDVMVGDSGSGGTKGLVPAPAIGDADKFLAGDSTYKTLPVPSASETVEGIAELATQAEVNTGTDNLRIVTPATLEGKINAEQFESAEQTITLAGNLTLAHGLNVAPKNYKAFLRCISANGNYAVGDETDPHDSDRNDNGPGYGVQVIIPNGDTTNIYIRFGNTAIVILNKTTGTVGNIDPTKWKLVVRASINF